MYSCTKGKKMKYFRTHMLGCFLTAALNCVKQCRIYRLYFEAVGDGVLWGSHCLCITGKKDLAISEWQGRQYSLLGCPKTLGQPRALHIEWFWFVMRGSSQIFIFIVAFSYVRQSQQQCIWIPSYLRSQSILFLKSDTLLVK